MEMYKGHTGIEKAASILLDTPTEELNNYQAKKSEQEILREEGRQKEKRNLAKTLLQQSDGNPSNEWLSKVTGLELSEQLINYIL